MSLTVDGATATPHGTVSSAANDFRQWYLPAYDPRNENKFMFRLHTIDFYFWTAEDATLFLNSMGTLLPPSQIRILDALSPPSAHADAMSPVVQQLENAAISSPDYHRGGSAIAGGSPATGQPLLNSNSRKNTTDDTRLRELPGDFAPLAYNPAAPAAPEQIKHREKTPPPPDAAGGTGLAAVAVEDSYPQHFTPEPLQYQKTQPTSPSAQHPGWQSQPQPQQSLARSDSLPTSISTAQAPPSFPSRNNSLAQSVSSASNLPGPPPAQSSGQPPQELDAQLQGQSPPGSQAVPSLIQPTDQSQPVIPVTQAPDLQAPPGGFATFSYGQPQVTLPPGATNPYAMHQQLYRPTEAEVKAKIPKPGVPAQQGKIEVKGAKVEKGVNKFLKKIEKKIG